MSKDSNGLKVHTYRPQNRLSKKAVHLIGAALKMQNG